MLRKVSFIVTLSLLVVATYGQSLKELVANGDKLVGKKNYKGAIDVYLSAIQINPDDAQLNFKLGLSMFEACLPPA